ncbi:DUF5673 domain-containing protein [Wukongibacter sp. M2B1]|uniref:DUF5673 domain-containing protein n=1 Tax=Wukongibacter sp. M2B1 TaxID=3088895 RepID=UPI003D7B790E
MDFEKLTLTIVNLAMVLAVVLYLREKLTMNKRSDSEGMGMEFEIKQNNLEKIPFLKHRSNKISIISLLVIFSIITLMGFKDIQAALESLVFGLMAGAYVLIQNKLDENKAVGIYEHGILYKSGFIHWRDVRGIEWDPSHSYKNSYDMVVKTLLKSKISLVVSNKDKQQVERIVESKINMS